VEKFFLFKFYVFLNACFKYGEENFYLLGDFNINALSNNTVDQWFPNIFVRGTLQGYFKWTRNPRQICQVNINAFFTQIVVIGVVL